MRMRVVLGVGLAASVACAGSAREDLVGLRAKLAAQRALGRPTGWAAELSFAQAHRKDPALAAEVMYDVAVTQREASSSQGAKTLEAILATHPKVEPWAALAAYDLARVYGDSSSTRSKAIELYEEFLKADHADPVRRAEARLGVARLYQAASKHKEAVAHFQAFAAEFPNHVAGCAEALASMGMLFVGQKDPKQAHEVYRKLSATYPWDVERRRTLLLAIAQAYRTAEEREAAIAAHEKLLEDLPRGDPRRVQVYTGLAMLHAQQKNNEAAIAVYRRMAKEAEIGASDRSSAYRQLFALRRQDGDYAGIIGLAYELIAVQPAAIQYSGTVLGELVDALVNEGRADEALGMAKAYHRLASLDVGYSGRHSHSSSSYSSAQSAVFAVVRALKAKEGSLRSANAFITFIERGPEGPDGRIGTKDDIEDPLASFALPPNPERDRLFAEAAKRFISDPYQLGYLYICWDKPAEALLAFRRHYLMTSETARLQAAASLVAGVMRALGRSETEVDAFFDFQNYGPNGKDGKPGTKDDLRDPILALKK